MLQLAEAGLVQFERNRGFRILNGSVREIADSIELRILLEVPAARVAAASRPLEALTDLWSEHAAMRDVAARGDQEAFLLHDERFHQIILAVTGNERLIAVVRNLRAATMYLGVSAEGFSRICAEHELILAALTANDSDASARVMEEHLRTTAKLLLAKYTKPGDELPTGSSSLVEPPLWNH